MLPDEPRSVAFRKGREETWRQLEALVTEFEARGARALDAEAARALPALYRATVSALAVARAIALDRNLLDYLESLCARAWLCIYGPKRRLREALADYARWWPAAVRATAAPIALAALALIAGVVAGFALTVADLDLFYAFVDPAYAGGRDPTTSTAELRDGLYAAADAEDALFTFASFLFGHNARIGILAFGLGVVLGLPTLYLMLHNGLLLGAFAGLYHARGLSLDLWGWLLPHGVTELSAVVVCGGAGLALARALLFPGRLSRAESLVAEGRRAAGVVMGAVVMFFIAAIIEGLFRQLVQDVTARYTLAAVTALALAGYLTLVGRELDPRQIPQAGPTGEGER
ncbi:MAG: stage II sporulation protein M [Myxococcales bacterium]|nr:stage II sporulation protein M [Myxococcales bacterium]